MTQEERGPALIGNNVGSSSSAGSGSSQQGPPGATAEVVVPYYTRLSHNILDQELFDWPVHWSGAEVSRVCTELTTITDEDEWYELINQINRCYRD